MEGVLHAIRASQRMKRDGGAQQFSSGSRSVQTALAICASRGGSFSRSAA